MSSKRIGKVTNWEIKITPSDNMGFVVSIGCATVVAEDVEGLLTLLNIYLEDPKGCEREYNSMHKEEIQRVPAPDDGADSAIRPLSDAAIGAIAEEKRSEDIEAAEEERE